MANKIEVAYLWNCLSASVPVLTTSICPCTSASPWEVFQALYILHGYWQSHLRRDGSYHGRGCGESGGYPEGDWVVERDNIGIFYRWWIKPLLHIGSSWRFGIPPCSDEERVNTVFNPQSFVTQRSSAVIREDRGEPPEKWNMFIYLFFVAVLAVWNGPCPFAFATPFTV